MSDSFPWSALGIEQTNDTGDIRRAYAKKLKTMDIDLDAPGYAKLRQARDRALAFANNAGRASSLNLPPRASPAQSLAAQSKDKISAETTPGSGSDADGDAMERDVPKAPMPPMIERTPGQIRPAVTAVKPAAIRPAVLAPVGLQGTAVPPGPTPEERLRQLLVGPGVQRDAPLSPTEEFHGRSHLRAILVRAASADLTQYEAIENWLADVMAQSWPRCAPLLEEAGGPFGWKNVAARFNEPANVTFIRGRLGGYLFQRDVRLVSHPFHGAWVELQKPGRAGAIRFAKSSWGPHGPRRFHPVRQQVKDLLAHIRRNFPEIESSLNRQRVTSWEEPPPSRKPSSFDFRIVAWVFMPMIWLLGALMNCSGSQQQYTPLQIAVPEAASGGQQFILPAPPRILPSPANAPRSPSAHPMTVPRLVEPPSPPDPLGEAGASGDGQ